MQGTQVWPSVRQLSRGTTTREAHWLRQRPNTPQKKKTARCLGTSHATVVKQVTGKSWGGWWGQWYFRYWGSWARGVGLCQGVWFCALETRDGPRREGAFGRNGEASRSDSVPRESGSSWVKGFLKDRARGGRTSPALLHSFTGHCGCCSVYTVKGPCILYCPLMSPFLLPQWGLPGTPNVTQQLTCRIAKYSGKTARFLQGAPSI